MKILLVSPDTPDTFWGLKHALKFISKKAALPPLGLLTVAAMLPKDWKLKLVDITVTELTDKDIRWADYVFISAMLIHKASVRQIIDRCKKFGKKLVAGGPLFTTSPEQYEDIDHLVLGEAEVVMPQFLEDLTLGSARHIYKSDRWANLQDTPLPLWKLLNTKQYASMSIQYSRGCPFDCDFCNVTALFGHKSRTKTKEQILTELQVLYDIDYRGGVFFVDDNFIGNKLQLKNEILPAVIDWMEKRKYPFAFNTQASVNLADDDELMRLMVRAGFTYVFVGIETPNEASLSECNKVQNKGRDLLNSVRKIQNAGMEVQGGFILGFDSDNQSIFENMVRFIQESGIVTAMVGLLNAPKGTKLYKRMANEKRLLNDGTGDNTDSTMNFIPAMDRNDLLSGYQKVLHAIYSRKNYYQRVLTFLRNYKPANISRVKVRYRDIKAFIKSLWYVGVLDKGRKYYWKLVFWALRRPQYLDVVLSCIICGIHFQKRLKKLKLYATDYIPGLPECISG